jgi:hypothetical protein
VLALPKFCCCELERYVRLEAPASFVWYTHTRQSPRPLWWYEFWGSIRWMSLIHDRISQFVTHRRVIATPNRRTIIGTNGSSKEEQVASVFRRRQQRRRCPFQRPPRRTQSSSNSAAAAATAVRESSPHATAGLSGDCAGTCPLGILSPDGGGSGTAGGRVDGPGRCGGRYVGGDTKNSPTFVLLLIFIVCPPLYVPCQRLVG